MPRTTNFFCVSVTANGNPILFLGKPVGLHATRNSHFTLTEAIRTWDRFQSDTGAYGDTRQFPCNTIGMLLRVNGY